MAQADRQDERNPRLRPPPRPQTRKRAQLSPKVGRARLADSPRDAPARHARVADRAPTHRSPHHSRIAGRINIGWTPYREAKGFSQSRCVDPVAEARFPVRLPQLPKLSTRAALRVLVHFVCCNVVATAA